MCVDDNAVLVPYCDPPNCLAATGHYCILELDCLYAPSTMANTTVTFSINVIVLNKKFSNICTNGIDYRNCPEEFPKGFRKKKNLPFLPFFLFYFLLSSPFLCTNSFYLSLFHTVLYGHYIVRLFSCYGQQYI